MAHVKDLYMSCLIEGIPKVLYTFAEDTGRFMTGDGWAVTKGNAKGPGTGRVSDVMTPAALTTEETVSVEEAGKLMLEYKVHRLLVEKDGELTGIVSTMDILRGLVGD